jgi:hypothetical protein
LRAIAELPTSCVLHDPAVNVVGIVCGYRGDPYTVIRRVYFMPQKLEAEVDSIATEVLDSFETKVIAHADKR